MSGSAAPPGLTVQSNGIAVLSDQYLNGLVQGGAVVADLQNFVALSNMTVMLVGYTVAGDGGQGLFYYNQTATTADDGGVTAIAPNGIVIGRWLRLTGLTGGVFSVSNIAALRALTNGESPVLVEGYYAPGDWGGGIYIIGAAGTDNGGSIITSANGTYYLANFASPFSVRQFGAMEDGTADDIPAVDATIAASPTGVFTNTQMNLPYMFLLNQLSPIDEYHSGQGSNNATQALVGGVAVPASSTVHEADGVTGYVTNSSTQTNAVGGAFYARALVANCQIWGINPLVDDNTNSCLMNGAEFDIIAKNTATRAYGVNVFGVFDNGTPTTSVGVQVAALGADPWGIAFTTLNGSANIGMSLGATSNAPNSDGQAINIGAVDSTGTTQLVGISAEHSTNGANLLLTTPTGGVVMTALELVTGFATFLGGMAVTATGSTLEEFFSGLTLVGGISTNGTSTAYNTTSDRRLKDIDSPSDGSVVDSLKVYTGGFKGSPSVKRSMLIADEVASVASWAVTGEKNAVRKDDVKSVTGRIIHRKGDMIPQMIDHSAFVPDLIAKCHALQKQNDLLVKQMDSISATLEKHFPSSGQAVPT